MSPTPYMVPEDAAGPLTDQEKRIVQRLFSSWQEVPLDFKRALSNSLMTDEDLALNTTQIFDLDRKLRGSVTTPPGIGVNEIVIWNGTAWARGGLANVTVLGLTAANTDFGWVGGTSPITFYNINGAGAGTLRNIQTPAYAGQRLVIKNLAAAAVTMLHNTAGTGAVLYNRSLANVVLLPNESIEYVFNGSLWDEINRDQASSGGLTGQITAAGGITAGTGFTCVRNSAGNYTVTFTTAFPAAPVVLFTVIGNQPIATADLIAVAAGSFNVGWFTAAGVAQDQAWQFLAVPMV